VGHLSSRMQHGSLAVSPLGSPLCFGDIMAQAHCGACPAALLLCLCCPNPDAHPRRPFKPRHLPLPSLPLCRSYLEQHRPLGKYTVTAAGGGQARQLPERVARYTAQGAHYTPPHTCLPRGSQQGWGAACWCGKCGMLQSSSRRAAI